MRKDEVTKIDKRTLDTVLTELANRREECDNLRNRLLVETCNNKELQKKIGYLEALFDKEVDTDVIKYNGKLYMIASTTNYIEAGVEETLDFTAIPVREVG